MEKPLVNNKYRLEKYPGKGGWTYVCIHEVLPDKTPFGMVKVSGSIDNYEFKNYRLMPAGNRILFLPVKAEIRKRIGKQQGDFVKIVLYRDDTPLDIPEDILLCLKDEPGAYEKFLGLKEGEQKAFIDWIYAARKEETQVERIAATIRKILEGSSF